MKRRKLQFYINHFFKNSSVLYVVSLIWQIQWWIQIYFSLTHFTEILNGLLWKHLQVWSLMILLSNIRWNGSCSQFVWLGQIFVNTLLKNVFIIARKRLVYNRGWVKSVIEWNFVFAISQPNGIETSKYPPMILMGVVARIVKFWCIWTKTLYEITDKNWIQFFEN